MDDNNKWIEEDIYVEIVTTPMLNHVSKDRENDQNKRKIYMKF